jgi:hypothetical protein
MADDSIAAEIIKTKEVCNRILEIMKIHDENMALLQAQINDIREKISPEETDEV